MPTIQTATICSPTRSQRHHPSDQLSLTATEPSPTTSATISNHWAKETQPTSSFSTSPPTTAIPTVLQRQSPSRSMAAMMRQSWMEHKPHSQRLNSTPQPFSRKSNSFKDSLILKATHFRLPICLLITVRSLTTATTLGPIRQTTTSLERFLSPMWSSIPTAGLLRLTTPLKSKLRQLWKMMMQTALLMVTQPTSSTHLIEPLI